jgi:hypothetical protein
MTPNSRRPLLSGDLAGPCQVFWPYLTMTSPMYSAAYARFVSFGRFF